MSIQINPLDNVSLANHLQACRYKMGNTIREMREIKGYNQEQLAKLMNVSRTTISKIESGKFNCSMDYLSKFSWYLKFEVNFKSLNDE